MRGGREGGKGGREGGEERDDCYHILMEPQYLNINHITYYVIT